MAITFTKDISQTFLNLAYNNNIVRFSSDNASPPMKCEITIDTVMIVIYPSPDNTFYYNFLEHIKSRINVDNFKDELSADIANDGYIYNWTDKVFLNTAVLFNIHFQDLSTESTTRDIKWLSAYVQQEDWKKKYPINLNLLQPFTLLPYEDKANNRAYAKYWEGYPFDISVYCGLPVGAELELNNISNLINYVFTDPFTVTRLFLSDGDINTTIDDVLTVDEGLNDIKITVNYLDYYLTLEKETDAVCGHYIKFINSLGGWSYWLFEKGNRNRATKDLGEINNDYSNLEDTISPTVQIGKNSNDIITTITGVLSTEQQTLIKDILDSPKIYLFTGQPYIQNSFNDWIEIAIKNNDFRVENAKQSLNQIAITFELPQRKTRTL